MALAIEPAPGLTRHYKGLVLVSTGYSRNCNSDVLHVRNSVSTKDYVTSVVGSESLPGCPKEALKAQSVLVLTKLARFKPGDRIGDSTEQQAYLGSDYERPGVFDAVNSVWQWRLSYDGSPIEVFYHSCCGGKTSRGVDVFGPAAVQLVYLTNVECPYCKKAPFFHPTVTAIPAGEFDRRFGSHLPVVLKIDPAGRPVRVNINRGGTKQIISGYQFWIELGRCFGWDKAPGTRFEWC